MPIDRKVKLESQSYNFGTPSSPYVEDVRLEPSSVQANKAAILRQTLGLVAEGAKAIESIHNNKEFKNIEKAKADFLSGEFKEPKIFKKGYKAAWDQLEGQRQATDYGLAISDALSKSNYGLNLEDFQPNADYETKKEFIEQHIQNTIDSTLAEFKETASDHKKIGAAQMLSNLSGRLKEEAMVRLHGQHLEYTLNSLTDRVSKIVNVLGEGENAMQAIEAQWDNVGAMVTSAGGNKKTYINYIVNRLPNELQQLAETNNTAAIEKWVEAVNSKGKNGLSLMSVTDKSGNLLYADTIVRAFRSAEAVMKKNEAEVERAAMKNERDTTNELLRIYGDSVTTGSTDAVVEFLEENRASISGATYVTVMEKLNAEKKGEDIKVKIGSPEYLKLKQQVVDFQAKGFTFEETKAFIQQLTNYDNVLTSALMGSSYPASFGYQQRAKATLVVDEEYGDGFSELLVHLKNAENGDQKSRLLGEHPFVSIYNKALGTFMLANEYAINNYAKLSEKEKQDITDKYIEFNKGQVRAYNTIKHSSARVEAAVKKLNLKAKLNDKASSENFASLNALRNHIEDKIASETDKAAKEHLRTHLEAIDKNLNDYKMLHEAYQMKLKKPTAPQGGDYGFRPSL